MMLILMFVVVFHFLQLFFLLTSAVRIEDDVDRILGNVRLGRRSPRRQTRFNLALPNADRSNVANLNLK